MRNSSKSVLVTVIFGAALFFSLFMAIFVMFNSDLILNNQPTAQLQTAGLAIYEAPKRGFFEW